MLRRLGYACVCLSVEDSSPRGTILRNATPERLRALTAANLTRMFADFLAVAPADVEFDCMLEAKAKDLALFRVRDRLGIAA